MKTTHLTVAVLAAMPALAFSQTNVQLSGYFKAGFAQTKLTNGATGNGSATSLVDGASQFDISGSEDLGGGLKAIFKVNNRFRVDDNSGSTGPLGTGAVWVGLEGGFGRIRTGKLDLLYYLGLDEHIFLYSATALQHSNFSLLGYVNSATVPIARGSRSTNALRYDLPAINGLSVGLNWSPNAAGSEGPPGNSSGQMYSFDATYAQGPLKLGATYWNEKTEGNTNSGQRAWRAFGTYDFLVAKIGLTFDNSTVRVAGTDTGRDAFSIPLTAKIGPGTGSLTYTQALDTKTSGNKNADTGAKMIALGYEYPLSKRTKLGASYAVINNESSAVYGLYTGAALGNLPSPVAGQDTKQFYIGLTHAY